VRWTERIKGIPAMILIVIGIVAGGFAIRGALGKKKADMVIPTASVERQDITVTVEANGTVEPISIVDVKSKASGQIIRMPVEIGSTVQPGDLLAQIDTRDVQNQYDQALATLKAAQAKSEVSSAQKKRADDLFSQQIITATEHESAVLDLANAQAQLVKARTDLDLARQRLEDATVTAPIAGTVIEKPVAVGQVISSATSSVSGGTSLLKMADLKQIRVRALVNETDIGNVRQGQPATVVVDAYPQRQFRGNVEKIEPQALVEQSVTMFPVLVSLSNEEGLLMPGMNGEVTMLVDSRENVLAVPIDAVRSVREIQTAALALGLDAAKIRSEIQAQMQNSTAARDSMSGGAASGRVLTDGDTLRWRAARGDSAGGRRLGGRGGRDSTGARRNWRGGAGGARSGGSGGGGFAGGGGTGSGGGGFATAGGSGGFGSAGASRSGGGQARLVFVKTKTGYEPRVVRLGLTDYDYAQVMGGVREGEEVVLLSAAELQQQRQQSMDQIRQRMGGGMTGMQGGSGTSRGSGSGSRTRSGG
jgi:HlyD family secretion protein